MKNQKLLRITGIKVTGEDAENRLDQYGFINIRSDLGPSRYLLASVPKLKSDLRDTPVFLLEHSLPEGVQAGPLKILRVHHGISRELDTARSFMMTTRGDQTQVVARGDSTISDWELDCVSLNPEEIKLLTTPTIEERVQRLKQDFGAIESRARKTLTRFIKIDNALLAFIKKYCGENEDVFVIADQVEKMSKARGSSVGAVAKKHRLHEKDIRIIHSLRLLASPLRELVHPDVPRGERLAPVITSLLSMIHVKEQVWIWNEAKKKTHWRDQCMEIQRLGKPHFIKYFSFEDLVSKPSRMAELNE